jgi:hypothetical protein
VDDVVSGDLNEFDIRDETRQALKNIGVGRKVTAFRDDLSSGTSRAGGSRCDLEEIHGGRVGNEYIVGRRTDERRDTATECRGQIDPTVEIPAFDEIAAPLPGHYILNSMGSGMSQSAEGIAVEINDVGRKLERGAFGRQRIFVIEAFTVFS